MSPRRRDLTPVGDRLVSFSADQMPTDTLAQLASETRADVANGETDARQGFELMSWLCRIAVQKLQAVES